MDCFTPIQVIGTSRFVLRDLGHHWDAETDFLFVDLLIRKPRKVDQGQKVPSEGRDSKNIAETLGTVGCRTQKSPKTADSGTKQRNKVGQRFCRHRTTSEEEAGAGTVPHVLTRAACVDLS